MQELQRIKNQMERRKIKDGIFQNRLRVMNENHSTKSLMNE